MLITIELDRIESDPKNVRKAYFNIDKLAESIAGFGLLQNLVVRERHDRPGSYVVVAGERRFRAIQLLSQKKEWTKGVPCLVITTRGDVENTIENVQREDVSLWDLGYRYYEWYEAGIDQGTIAARVGKSQSHVSLCIQLARGLCPRLVKSLSNLGPGVLTQSQLLRLSKLWDEEAFEPDETAQWKLFQKMLSEKPAGNRRKRHPIPERERVYQRFTHLRRGFTVPNHAQPYVEAVIRYLSGESKRMHFPRP